MSMRFKILAGVYLALILALAGNTESLGGVYDIFASLAALLVFAVIALWPTTTAADRADGAAGAGWADRIEFEDRPRD